MEFRHIEILDEHTIRRTGDDYSAVKEAVIFAMLAQGEVRFYSGIDEFPTVIRSRDFTKRFGELHRAAFLSWFTESEPTEMATASQSHRASC